MLLAGVGAALGPAPFAAAQTTPCDLNDFRIPDSEPADSNARDLTAGAMEVGTEDVLAGSEETLHVEVTDIGANGQLNWTVFYDDGSGCVKLDPNDCEGEIFQEFQEKTCTLEDPSSDKRIYHVEFVAGNQNAIDYKTWST